MAFDRKTTTAQYLRFSFTLMLVIILMISVTPKFGLATRPFHGEEWLKKHFVPLASLQRGPVQPSGHEPIGHDASLNGMHFAGRFVNHPPPPPAFLGSNSADLLAA
ncbi:hypothetical protein Tsubulata_043723 [Turnera subulata]|uniref:Transmembrane protein n=1 Tax=Turnera subulata TaxID=218843 RepID=A0A9Q0FNJ0_9ROSI|nr:hypothetical protein Tsubulata_043723 [Turnera subulata]